MKRSARLLCKEEGKAEGEGPQAAEEAAEAAEVVGPEEPEDPFAGLDLDSKEFLQRKVDVLEKELQEANARVAELEGDAAAAEPLVAKGIMKSTKVCPPPSGLLHPRGRVFKIDATTLIREDRESLKWKQKRPMSPTRSWEQAKLRRPLDRARKRSRALCYVCDTLRLGVKVPKIVL